MKRKYKTIEITAVWLRRIGKSAEVLVERDGTWYLAIREDVDGSFSHIAEVNGADNWPEDEVTAKPEAQ